MKTGLFELQKLFNIEKVYGKPLKSYQKGPIPYVTGTIENNGVVGYVSAPLEAISAGNCISIDPITGKCYFQPTDFVGRGFSGASINLIYNENLNEKRALFICASIEKYATKVAGYGHLFNSTRLKEAKIELPIISKDEPDWEYMENYIAELEKDRVAELEKYLIATGLNDYELTEEDKHILSLSRKTRNYKDGYSENFDGIWWKEFIVENILNVEYTNSIPAKSNLNEGNIPYVTRTTSNNGYQQTCGNIESLNSGNCITIGAETAVAFYQPQDFVAGNKMYRISKEGLNEKHYLFLASMLNKKVNEYSYSNARILDKIKKETIYLPIYYSKIEEECTPNWEYMEKYIRVIEKLAIKNVVEWKDKELNILKNII